MTFQNFSFCLCLYGGSQVPAGSVWGKFLGKSFSREASIDLLPLVLGHHCPWDFCSLASTQVFSSGLWSMVSANCLYHRYLNSEYSSPIIILSVTPILGKAQATPCAPLNCMGVSHIFLRSCCLDIPNPQEPCHSTILTPQGREWGVCLQWFPPSGKRAQVPIFTSHSLQKSFPCSDSFCPARSSWSLPQANPTLHAFCLA